MEIDRLRYDYVEGRTSKRLTMVKTADYGLGAVIYGAQDAASFCRLLNAGTHRTRGILRLDRVNRTVDTVEDHFQLESHAIALMRDHAGGWHYDDPGSEETGWHAIEAHWKWLKIELRGVMRMVLFAPDVTVRATEETENAGNLLSQLAEDEDLVGPSEPSCASESPEEGVMSSYESQKSEETDDV